MMTEQQLQAVIEHANEIGATAPTLAADLCATIAEVRRLQQQERGHIDRLRLHIEEVVLARRERDAALAERQLWEDIAMRRMEEAEHAESALTEARRVLREIEWRGHTDMYRCPSCGMPKNYGGHLTDCALAAVIAQDTTT